MTWYRVWGILTIMSASFLLACEPMPAHRSQEQEPTTQEDSASGTSTLPAQFGQLIELHNKARSDQLDKEFRMSCPFSRSAKAVQWNRALTRAAQRQADWMAEQNRLSHGTSIKRRAKSVGYNYRIIGENIAYSKGSPSEVMQSWLTSPAHCNNIMNPMYVDIGIARNGNYWAVILGREL